MKKVLIVTLKKWNITNYQKFKKRHNKNIKCYIVSNNSKLKISYLKKINPDLIFFLHWSSKVKKNIINNFNCFNFHMTDLPFGQGGTPLQNLLFRDIEKTKISLIKMNEKIDEGNIIYKENFLLNGSAGEIYNALSNQSYKIIEKIIKKKKIIDVKQTGKLIKFSRIKFNNLLIKKKQTLKNIYNQIRMRDADTYEKTYVQKGKFRIYLYDSKIKSKNIYGKFKITKV